MKRIFLSICIGLIPFFTMAQIRKKPYGVTTITTPAGSKLAPTPSEEAIKYQLDISIRRDGEFIMEMKEYQKGVYVKSLLGDRIIGGMVKEGYHIKFVQFLDFKGGKNFQLFTYVETSMWYKSENTEKKFHYVQYEGNSDAKTTYACPLFLIYEDNENDENEKRLQKLLRNGKLPDKYTPQSESLKNLSRSFIVSYHY